MQPFSVSSALAVRASALLSKFKEEASKKHPFFVPRVESLNRAQNPQEGLGLKDEQRNPYLGPEPGLRWSRVPWLRGC